MYYHPIKTSIPVLRDAIEDGSYYWRPAPNDEYEHMDAPMVQKYTHIMEPINQVSIVEPYGYVDLNWDGDMTTRKLVTGLAIMLAGAPIAYRIKS